MPGSSKTRLETLGSVEWSFALPMMSEAFATRALWGVMKSKPLDVLLLSLLLLLLLLVVKGLSSAANKLVLPTEL